VQDAQGSKRGFLNKDDFLTITTSGGKPFQATDIHLKGESGDAWREHIQHASRGALASEKVGAPAAGFQAVAAALTAAPPAGVIEFPHAPEDELAARFPQGGGSLACSTGTRLNVGENQQAILFSSGRFFDRLNPGVHTLSPLDTPLLASAPGFSTTSFSVQVYFVKTLQFRDISWGTIEPISVKAEGTVSGVANLKAYGKYSFVISDPLLFLNQLAGDRTPFTLAEMRAYVVLYVADAINDLLTRQGRQVSDLIFLTGEVNPAIIAQVREKAASHGVNLFQFTVEAINAEEF
jgi:membrane protease subunit (stomatin/prohibitin family)